MTGWSHRKALTVSQAWAAWEWGLPKKMMRNKLRNSWAPGLGIRWRESAGPRCRSGGSLCSSDTWDHSDSDPSWLVQRRHWRCLVLGVVVAPLTLNPLPKNHQSRWRYDLSTQTWSLVTLSVTPAFSGFVNMVSIYSINPCSHIHSQVMLWLSIVTGRARRAKNPTCTQNLHFSSWDVCSHLRSIF